MITEERGPEFSSNGYLEKNLDGLIQRVIEDKDKSVNILVLGRPGSGKSSLDIFLSNYLDPDFSLDNVAFTHDQWYKNCTELAKKEISVHSEGRNTYNRLRAQTNNYQEGQDIIYQWRFKNHVRFIEFQHLRHFPEELLKEMIHGLIRCFNPESRNAPFCHFYSKGQIQKIRYFNKQEKTVKFPDPSFRDYWPDPEEELPEFWREYDRRNEEQLKKGGKSEEEKAYKGNYVSVGEAAERLGVHEDTIRNWCDDGKLDHGRIPSGARRIKESEIMRVVRDPVSPSAQDS